MSDGRRPQSQRNDSPGDEDGVDGRGYDISVRGRQQSSRSKERLEEKEYGEILGSMGQGPDDPNATTRQPAKDESIIMEAPRARPTRERRGSKDEGKMKKRSWKFRIEEDREWESGRVGSGRVGGRRLKDERVRGRQDEDKHRIADNSHHHHHNHYRELLFDQRPGLLEGRPISF